MQHSEFYANFTCLAFITAFKPFSGVFSSMTNLYPIMILFVITHTFISVTPLSVIHLSCCLALVFLRVFSYYFLSRYSTVFQYGMSSDVSNACVYVHCFVAS